MSTWVGEHSVLAGACLHSANLIAIKIGRTLYTDGRTRPTAKGATNQTQNQQQSHHVVSKIKLKSRVFQLNK